MEEEGIGISFLGQSSRTASSILGRFFDLKNYRSRSGNFKKGALREVLDLAIFSGGLGR
jgi:hypothetical protein